MATSIWSSETPAGRWAAAMRPAVSPVLMRTSDASDGAGAAAARSRADAVLRRGAAGAGAGRLSSVLPAAAGEGPARRGAVRRPVRGGGLGRSRHGRRQLLQGGRIQQQGVVALQVARGPAGVDHQIDKGLVDGLGACESQHGRSVRATLHADAHLAGRGVVLHALGAEDAGRGHAHAQAFGFSRRDLGISTSARRGSPRADCTFTRPRASAQASEAGSATETTAAAASTESFQRCIKRQTCVDAIGRALLLL